jgi:hypothetical protein
MCSDFVRIAWSDPAGRRFANIGLLEDVSTDGLCMNLDRALPVGSRIHLHTKGFEGEAEVRYCDRGDYGFLIGLEFADGCTWEPEKWRPKHLYTPVDQPSA